MGSFRDTSCIGVSILAVIEESGSCIRLPQQSLGVQYGFNRSMIMIKGHTGSF